MDPLTLTLALGALGVFWVMNKAPTTAGGQQNLGTGNALTSSPNSLSSQLNGAVGTVEGALSQLFSGGGASPTYQSGGGVDFASQGQSGGQSVFDDPGLTDGGIPNTIAAPDAGDTGGGLADDWGSYNGEAGAIPGIGSFF